jgi:hypothetical protein
VISILSSLLAYFYSGLTPAMFVNENTITLDPFDFKVLDELEASPDPDAGLYIRARSGKIVKAVIPKYCLAFQTGEGICLMGLRVNISIGNSNCGKIESGASSRASE